MIPREDRRLAAARGNFPATLEKRRRSATLLNSNDVRALAVRS